MKKDIVLMLHQMSGGGAERVMVLLANWLAEKGHAVSLILTNQLIDDVKGYKLNSDIDLMSLKEMRGKQTYISKTRAKSDEIYGKVSYKLSKKTHKKPSDKAVLKKYISRYSDEINALNDFMLRKKTQQ